MMTYIGDGSFLPGIPARDLTPDDIDALGPAWDADMLWMTGLYAPADEPAGDDD